MRYYPYEEFRDDTNSLISTLLPTHFDAIVTIARGGLILSHALAQGLGVRDVRVVNTRLYDNAVKRSCIEIMNSCSLEGLNSVLVVDDIADSGETLREVVRHLEAQKYGTKLVTCTLFYKKSSVFEPDFWIQEASEWIEFFWERDFMPI